MKATDLMIGDWVCYDGDENHKCPVRIDGISKEEAGVDGDWLDVWEPVPLTPEILEKNGFEHERNVGYVYEDYSSDTKVIVDFWDNTIKVVHNYDVKFNYTYYDNIMVHRFQHILKDLEIEKEIVLCKK